MAIEVPEYLLPSEGATVAAPPVAPRGGNDLPEFSPDDFQAVDEEKPDWSKRWLAAIARIREADTAHQFAHLSLLGRDERAARVVAVWPLTAPTFEHPADSDPEGSAQKVLTQCWMKIWNPAIKAKNPFVQLVAAAAGLSDFDAESAARMCVQNRLIYPDGTVSPGAERFVKVDAARVILQRQQPPRRTPRDTPPARQS